MIECKIPLSVTLPDLTIPIHNSKGKKIGVAVQTKIRSGLFSFQPKLKGSMSRNNFDFKFEYEPKIEDNKIKSISLSVKYTM